MGALPAAVVAPCGRAERAGAHCARGRCAQVAPLGLWLVLQTGTLASLRVELAAKTDEFRQRLKNGEDVNGPLLEEAFAVVREAAW